MKLCAPVALGVASLVIFLLAQQPAGNSLIQDLHTWLHFQNGHLPQALRTHRVAQHNI